MPEKIETKTNWLSDFARGYRYSVNRDGVILTYWMILSAPLRFSLWLIGSSLVWLSVALGGL